MTEERSDRNESLELAEPVLSLVAGGSYRARGSRGGFDDGDGSETGG